MHFVHILRLSWPHLSPSPDTQPPASLQVLPSDSQLCMSCNQKPLPCVSAFPHIVDIFPMYVLWQNLFMKWLQCEKPCSKAWINIRLIGWAFWHCRFWNITSFFQSPPNLFGNHRQSFYIFTLWALATIDLFLSLQFLIFLEFHINSHTVYTLKSGLFDMIKIQNSPIIAGASCVAFL